VNSVHFAEIKTEDSQATTQRSQNGRCCFTARAFALEVTYAGASASRASVSPIDRECHSSTKRPATFQ
jgi:hypothetical protein